MDDAPVARADTDTLSPGQTTADGNVLTGAGTTSGVADMQGADSGVTVVGVAAGNGPGGVAPGTVGVAIVGAHGTLTLNADGSYSYVATSGGGNDVFTYTTRDADGSLAHDADDQPWRCGAGQYRDSAAQYARTDSGLRGGTCCAWC